MFNLSPTPKAWQWPVTGQVNQENFAFIGEFYATESQEDVNRRLVTITKFVESLTDEDIDAIRLVVDEIFIGWVNLPDQEDQWVCVGGPGTEAVECSEDGRAQMLGQPMVAQAICRAWMEAMGADRARLGNSKRPRGFSSMAAASQRPRGS